VRKRSELDNPAGLAKPGAADRPPALLLLREPDFGRSHGAFATGFCRPPSSPPVARLRYFCFWSPAAALARDAGAQPGLVVSSA